MMNDLLRSVTNAYDRNFAAELKKAFKNELFHKGEDLREVENEFKRETSFFFLFQFLRLIAKDAILRGCAIHIPSTPGTSLRHRSVNLDRT